MSYFWNYAVPSFGSYDFSSKTWDTNVTCKVTINTPSDSFYAYKIKYFYHPVGGSDPYGHFSSWEVAHWMDQTETYEVQLPFGNCQAGQTYNVYFELWYTTSYGEYQASQVTYSTSIQIKKPPLYTWAWAPNVLNSWNTVMHQNNDDYADYNEALSSSARALTRGGQTIGFKRRIWNDMIDWLIYTYKIATGNSFNESDFNGWSGSTSYLSLLGDSAVLTAEKWNLMGRIGNYAATALGGSSFINTSVQTGDSVTHSIFNDITITINNLINNYLN